MAIRSGAVEGVGMNVNFWSGKKVFLTGHTGFKGGWLSLWLQQMGANVTGYSLPPPTDPSLFDSAHVGEGMASIIGDIRDKEALSRAMCDSSPEIVIHMEAPPLVLRAYADPVETYSTNVMGTVHLLEAVRRCADIRSVVIVTTDKCYENREWVWGYRENDPLGGYDPYSSSKSCSEFVTSAYRRSFFNPDRYSEHRVAVASARAGNVIGGGDWSPGRLIPDVIRAFANGHPVTIRNPLAVRPWQHVLEPLRGYLILAEQLYRNGGKFADSFNFGPRDEDVKPVKWIVQEISRLIGKGVWVTDQACNPHEAAHLKLDISKAADILEWHPVLDIENALGMTIDWVRGISQGRDARQLTIDQISSYQACLAVN